MTYQDAFGFKLCFVLALLLEGVGLAAASSPTDSIKLLDAVVVSATQRQESIIPPREIKGETLKQLNCFSVADAMCHFSGVQVKDYGGVGGIKTINIRSMGSHHVGIFYDGVELGNAQNGQIDLGQYALSSLEAIELYNGQKGGTLQPAKDFGSSGTVYLRTRRPRFEEDKPYNVQATLKSGSFGLVNPALVWEQRIGRLSSLALSGEYTFATGRYKFRYRRINPSTGETAYDTLATRENGDITAGRIEATLFGTLPNWKYQLKSYNYLSKRGIPGAIVNNVWRRGERMRDANYFVQAMLEGKVANRYRLKALGKYAYYYTHFKNSDPTTLLIDNRYKQQELYISLAQSLELMPRWHASLAYDFLYNYLDSDLRDFVFPRRYTHLVALSTTYHNHWLDGQASLLGSFVHDKAKLLLEQPQIDRLSPALLLAITPLARVPLKVQLFYKRSFRMPTFNDLYYTDIGNSKLKPEYTEQYSCTLLYQDSWEECVICSLEGSVSVYHNRVKDKIIAYPKGQQFRWTMLNLGQVSISGLEVNLALSNLFFGQLATRLHLQYSYQNAIDVTNPQDSYYRHQIPYVPKHSGSASLALSFRKWQLSYSFIYAGERYNQKENRRYNHMQPWYTSDLSIAYDLALPKEQALRLQVECNNLLNQQYDVIINYPMPGRNWTITAQWNL